jgi:hypothetical protein
MKQINKYRAWSLAILLVIIADCESSDDMMGISVVPVITSEVTSSEKHSLYGFTHKELKAIQFAQLNWSNLTADMARGQGENLTAIADLLSIHGTKKVAFYAVVKNKFSQFIPTADNTAEQLVLKLKIESAKL